MRAICSKKEGGKKRASYGRTQERKRESYYNGKETTNVTG